jgi:hypothetical protein
MNLSRSISILFLMTTFLSCKKEEVITEQQNKTTNSNNETILGKLQFDLYDFSDQTHEKHNYEIASLETIAYDDIFGLDQEGYKQSMAILKTTNNEKLFVKITQDRIVGNTVHWIEIQKIINGETVLNIGGSNQCVDPTSILDVTVNIPEKNTTFECSKVFDLKNQNWVYIENGKFILN